MKYLFLLSGDFIELGVEEAISTLKIKNIKVDGNLLFAQCGRAIDAKWRNRIALTKCAYKILFECRIENLQAIFQDFKWDAIYKENFCVRVNCKDDSKDFSNLSEKDLAGYIWRSIKNPKVNLKNPRTQIEIFLVAKTAYCTLLVFRNNEKFRERNSHFRPFPHPSSLNPKLARALVNISEAKKDEILLDPFCGTGGILLEAGLIGLKTIGYDINPDMADGCARNLEHFGVKKFNVLQKNALNITVKFDRVVTDLPYGINSNAITRLNNWKKHRLNRKIDEKNFKRRLEIFYSGFLKILRKKLKKKAVIVSPSFVNYRKILKNCGFKIEKEFSNYVHSSLTRKILKIV